MAQCGPLPDESVPDESLRGDDARERAVEELSLHFAHDRLTMDEFERRLELAYQAKSDAELTALTADLGPVTALAPLDANTPVTAAIVPQSERMLSIMSDTKRRGPWVVPRRLDFVSLMSSARLDFTDAVLPNGVVDVHVRAMWSSTTIVVPRGVTVVNHLTPFMGSVSDHTQGAAPAGAPVIRLTGTVLMAELTIADA